jgi:hypothetical protein
MRGGRVSERLHGCQKPWHLHPYDKGALICPPENEPDDEREDES